MILALFGFLHISLADILDILLVALIIFLLFRWIRSSTAWSILVAILSLYVIRFIVSTLGMKLTATLMGLVLDVGVLALIVIFQPEIRRFLIKLGNRYRMETTGNGFLRKMLSRVDSAVGLSSDSVNEITEACRRMSEAKTGALIVIAKSDQLNEVIETGDRINSAIHRRLIMNLFFKNSPLHDGAIVISEERIVAARCTLPITEKTDIPPNYGMRHKAAIGISEGTDAEVVVVSEETGGIVFVKDGTVTPIANINELKLLLSNSLAEKGQEDAE